MTVLTLENYDLKDKEKYFQEGFFIGDIISIHRCFAHLSGTSEDLDFGNISHIAGVASYVSTEKNDKKIIYEPFAIGRANLKNLPYLAAHEVMHIRHNDAFRIRWMQRLLIILGISMFYLFSMFVLPLVVIIPVIINLIYWTFRREIETIADIGSLEFISMNTVMNFIYYSEPVSKFGWLWFDHTTTTRFLRKLKKMKLEIEYIGKVGKEKETA